MERVCVARRKTGRETRRKWLAPVLSVFAVAFITLATIICTRTDWGTLDDEYKGRDYNPSAQISAISDELHLTRKGRAVFYATYPELATGSDFNRHCSQNSDTLYTLGCYYRDANDREHIYLYDTQTDKISDNSLSYDFKTRRKVTALHELLHAAYARAGSNQICGDLRTIVTAIPQLEQVLTHYSAAQYCTEAFARVGAEYIAPLYLDKSDSLFEHLSIGRDLIERVANIYDDYFTFDGEFAIAHWRNQNQLSWLESTLSQTSSQLNTERSVVENLLADYNVSPNHAKYLETNQAIMNYNSQLENYRALSDYYQKINQTLDSTIDN